MRFEQNLVRFCATRPSMSAICFPIKNGYQSESYLPERPIPCFLSMRLPYISCVCMLVKAKAW